MCSSLTDVGRVLLGSGTITQSYITYNSLLPLEIEFLTCPSRRRTIDRQSFCGPHDQMSRSPDLQMSRFSDANAPFASLPYNSAFISGLFSCLSLAPITSVQFPSKNRPETPQVTCAYFSHSKGAHKKLEANNHCAHNEGVMANPPHLYVATSLRGPLVLLAALRPYEYLAVLHLGHVGLDRSSGGTVYDAPIMHIELRPMPGALDGASDQRAIGERPASVGAVIAEGDESVGTAPNRDASASNIGEEHLPFLQIGLLAHWRIPTIEFDRLPLSRVGETMVDADLVAIDQRRTHPAGGKQQQHADRGQDEGKTVGLRCRFAPVYRDGKEHRDHGE